MSIGKILGGTTLAVPAIGGGGYITYRELTKEETTEDNSATSNTPDQTPQQPERSDTPPTGTAQPLPAAPAETLTPKTTADGTQPGAGSVPPVVQGQS